MDVNVRNMAKKTNKIGDLDVKKPIVAPSVKLKEFTLLADFLPKKKGDKIKLNKEGERILKARKLIQDDFK